MKNKKFLIVIPIIIALFFAGFIILHFISTKNIQKRMFKEIEDFAKLQPYEIGDAEIIDTSNLENYDIVSSYESKILYESNEYEVYAYVFKYPMDCYYYFSGYSVNFPSDEYDSWNYCLTLGVEYGNGSYCDFMIYSEKNLYRIVGKDKKGVINFLNWLNADFEIKLD